MGGTGAAFERAAHPDIGRGQRLAGEADAWRTHTGLREVRCKNRHLLDHWAVWNGFRLSQTTADAFSIRKRTHADRPWIGTFSGTRAPGYVFAGDVSGGLGVALKDFWQSYPTALQVDSAAAGMPA